MHLGRSPFACMSLRGLDAHPTPDPYIRASLGFCRPVSPRSRRGRMLPRTRSPSRFDRGPFSFRTGNRFGSTCRSCDPRHQPNPSRHVNCTSRSTWCATPLQPRKATNKTARRTCQGLEGKQKVQERKTGTPARGEKVGTRTDGRSTCGDGGGKRG